MVWYCHKNTYRDQWNRIKNVEINPGIYCKLVFDRIIKNISEDDFFNKEKNTLYVGKTGYLPAK